MPTTFRQDARAAVLAVLVARQGDGATQLRKVYRARPGAFPATPCAYIAGSDERITYTAQTRNREMTGLECVLVDNLIDALTEEDRMDVLVDALVDDFWSAFNSLHGRGLLQLTSIRDADITLDGPNGSTTYRGAVFGFGDPANPTFVREGGP